MNSRGINESMPVIKEISESSTATAAIVRSNMTLPDGEGGGTSFRMFFSACDNAACSCTDLAISMVEDGKENPNESELMLTVDIGSKKLVPREKNNKFAKHVVSHFDAQDWQTLWRTFYDIKLEYTENLDAEHTFAKFPMQNAIETEGELVAYREILPHGRKFFIESSEGTILLDEQYCLRRGCDCDSVVICFLPIKDGEQTGEPAMAEVRYRTGKVKSSNELGSFTQKPEELFQIFLSMYPDLLKHFSKRHKQLTLLYGAYRKSQPMTVKNETSKVGRNEPCPCGSGKKFKKCCATNSAVEIGL